MLWQCPYRNQLGWTRNRNSRFAHGWFCLVKYSVCLKYEKMHLRLYCTFFPLNKNAQNFSKLLHWEKPDPIEASCLQCTARQLCSLSKVRVCAVSPIFFSSNLTCLSTLFAYRNFYLNVIKMKKHARHPLNENWTHPIKSGWLGWAMVLGSSQCRGVLLLLHIVGQGYTVLAAGAGLVGYIFFIFHLSSISNVLSFGRWLTMTEILQFWLLNPNGSCQLLPRTSSLSTG